ncbi:hypothetical protein AAC03nite_38170 [Alicyclobacillus acidoterrestris]|nr:hypothetical protein AAC03nite_38170 [Alicyclobacillus acidoterrestris]
MLQPGDLIFVRGAIGSLVDDAIKFAEWEFDHAPLADNYVHVAVYLGGNKVLEAQGFRRSGEGIIGQYANDYDIGHIEMTDEQRAEFMRALRDEDNLPYDWPGIFWLGVAVVTMGLCVRKYHEHKRRYCSKYVGWALARAGFHVNDRTPQDLAMDPIVKIEKVPLTG